jgi:pimeloyl-ACP methyl ester carboxylesterase
MRWRETAGAALLWAMLTTFGAGAAEERVTIDTRPGVSQTFYVTRPAVKPLATLLLFTGGDGKLRRYGPPDLSRGNFLVRSRDLFLAEGFAVAVIDAPSDHPDGMGAFRTSPQHAADIAAVVTWLRRADPAPLWLIGTSRGSISAALGAATAPDVAGLVLTSSMTRAPRSAPQTIYDAGLDRIRIPTLVVHHRDDRCPSCPFAGMPALLRSLANAPRAELIAVEGGAAPRSEPCEALSAHGYLGLEREVVRFIAAWIRNTP